MPRPTAPVNNELASFLQSGGFPTPFIELVGRALGDPLSAELLGFYAYMNPDPVMAVAFLVTTGRFILVELTPENVSQVNTIALRHVTRVQENTDPGGFRVLVEYGGDLEVIAQVTPVEGRVSFARHVLEATTPEAQEQLLRFSIALRSTFDR